MIQTSDVKNLEIGDTSKKLQKRDYDGFLGTIEYAKEELELLH
ncbi:hypothetical protein [Echinicola shivajiensis]|nr:hypothetical protein [Echinicola shivajiensis]